MQRIFRAQGATEYLVLLAVVLIIALVSIALLGFFPGMASDANEQQSRIYWQSQSPIAIIEWNAGEPSNQPGRNFPYMRIRNTGSYPIRITKILGNYNQSISQVYTGAVSNISDFYYLSPGEESYFGTAGYNNLPAHRQVDFYVGTSGSSGISLYGLTSRCSMTPPYGTMNMKNFGFEYIQYTEGQAITKREVGSAPLVIRCIPI